LPAILAVFGRLVCGGSDMGMAALVAHDLQVHRRMPMAALTLVCPAIAGAASVSLPAIRPDG